MNTKQDTDAPDASTDKLDSLQDDADTRWWVPRRAGDRPGAPLNGLPIWVIALPFIAWLFVLRFGMRTGVWVGAVAPGLALAICSFIAVTFRPRRHRQDFG